MQPVRRLCEGFALHCALGKARGNLIRIITYMQLYNIYLMR